MRASLAMGAGRIEVSRVSVRSRSCAAQVGADGAPLLAGLCPLAEFPNEFVPFRSRITTTSRPAMPYKSGFTWR
jgi:hypothetical protein